MSTKRLAGKKVLMVIAPVDFRDEELLEPKRILTEAGAEVTVASTRAGQAKGMLGAVVNPDIVIDKARSSDYQAVVVAGGMGSLEHLWENKHLHALLQDLHGDGRVVAGICLSGAVLARAGVLAGRKGTVWATPESLAAMKDGKCTYVKEPVVEDGNAITAEGPDAAGKFGAAIAHALERVTARV